MTASEAWSAIVDGLLEEPREFPTVPKTKRTPVWFFASTDGETITINEARINKPSSKLSMPRKLEYKTFLKIHPLYLKREQGEQVSAEATAVTVNQVYYYSLIHHLCR